MRFPQLGFSSISVVHSFHMIMGTIIYSRIKQELQIFSLDDPLLSKNNAGFILNVIVNCRQWF